MIVFFDNSVFSLLLVDGYLFTKFLKFLGLQLSSYLAVDDVLGSLIFECGRPLHVNGLLR